MIELLPARLAMSVVAGFGALFVVVGLTRLLRLRHPLLRSLLCGLGIAEVLLSITGHSSLTVLLVRVDATPQVLHAVLGTWTAPLLACWAGIAGGLMARRLLGARRVSRTAAALTALAPPSGDVERHARRAARLARAPAFGVVLLPGVEGESFAPCVVGVLRPLVLVPEGMWRALPERARTALLLHEAVHVRRRDPARLLLLGLVVDMLFFNWPLRRLAARLVDAWESAADRGALRGGASALGLAESVAAGLEGAAAPRLGVAFAGRSGSAAARLRDARRPPRRVVVAAQILALALLLPAGLPVRGATGVDVARHPGGGRGRVSIGMTWRAGPALRPLLPHLLERLV